MNHVGHGESTDDDGHWETQELDERDVGFNLIGPVEGQNLEGQKEEREIVEHGKFFEGTDYLHVLDVDLTIQTRKSGKKSKSGPGEKSAARICAAGRVPDLLAAVVTYGLRVPWNRSAGADMRNPAVPKLALRRNWPTRGATRD